MNEQECTLSDKQLITECEAIVKRLCENGLLTMSVPVNFNRDGDMLLLELTRRFAGGARTVTPQPQVWQVGDKAESYEPDNMGRIGSVYKVTKRAVCVRFDFLGGPTFHDFYFDRYVSRKHTPIYLLRRVAPDEHLTSSSGVDYPERIWVDDKIQPLSEAQKGWIHNHRFPKTIEYVQEAIHQRHLLAATAPLKEEIERLREYRYQQRISAWMKETFSDHVRLNVQERAMRFLEEATELCQSIGLPKDMAAKIQDYVYGRPEGAPEQEVGGVMVTLAALCDTVMVDMQGCGETELARINQPEIKAIIQAKQVTKQIIGITPEAITSSTKPQQ